MSEGNGGLHEDRLLRTAERDFRQRLALESTGLGVLAADKVGQGLQGD